MSRSKSMGRKGFILIFLSCAGLAVGQARRIDLQLSYGGWTLSPFGSVIETECERVIKSEFDRLVGSSIPDILLSPFLSNVDLSSSGHSFSLAIWYRFGDGAISAGLRGDYFNFRIPFSFSVAESLDILGFPLVAVDSRGQGTVRLNGLAVSLLVRGTLPLTSRLELSLEGGLRMMPFRGEIFLDQTTSLSTPVGDLQVSGSFDRTIAEVRDQGLDLPSSVFSLGLGAELRYRFARNAGIFFNVTAGQGSFYSGGLFFYF